MEIAEKDADKAEQEAYKDNEVEIVPGTPPGRKRTHTLVNRTPGKPPTPARPPPGRQQLSVNGRTTCQRQASMTHETCDETFGETCDETWDETC